MVQLVNLTTGEVLAGGLKYASSFKERLRGLMFTREFPRGLGGLIIDPCRGVHTFFMGYPIDVLFLDGEGQVVYLQQSLRPYRVSPYLRDARLAVELPAGTLQGKETRRGHHLGLG